MCVFLSCNNYLSPNYLFLFVCQNIHRVLLSNQDEGEANNPSFL